MTRIAERTTKMRAETSARYRGKPLMVSVEPYELVIREKGRRQCYAVPYIAVFELGARLAAEERRREKREKRGKS
jgi:hypothetical protein